MISLYNIQCLSFTKTNYFIHKKERKQMYTRADHKFISVRDDLKVTIYTGHHGP